MPLVPLIMRRFGDSTNAQLVTTCITWHYRDVRSRRLSSSPTDAATYANTVCALLLQFYMDRVDALTLQNTAGVAMRSILYIARAHFKNFLRCYLH